MQVGLSKFRIQSVQCQLPQSSANTLNMRPVQVIVLVLLINSFSIILQNGMHNLRPIGVDQHSHNSESVIRGLVVPWLPGPTPCSRRTSSCIHPTCLNQSIQLLFISNLAPHSRIILWKTLIC
jgi:hypothetical protein